MELSDRGYEKLASGKYREAKEYFHEALSINPENPFALINLGVVFEKEGAYPEAVEMYQKVISTGTAEVARNPAGYTGEDISLVEIARENIVHVREIMEKKQD